MNGQHAIDELVLDLSFSSSRLTRHEQAELADWVSQEFLPQLDKLFSVYSAGSQVLQFENIKLDLGWLPARYYRQEIVRQTCAQLEFLIAQASLQISSSPGISGNRENQGINLYQQQLEQLLIFLRTGQLPFHRDNTNALVAQRAHEQLLEKVLDKHNLLAVLRALPQRKELLKRLTNQFSPRHLSELLRQIAPEQFSAVQALLDLWELAQTPLPVFTQTVSNNLTATHAASAQSIPGSETSISLPPVKSLWAIILELFLNRDFINQPVSRWLMPILEQLQQQYSLTPTAIAQRLLSHMPAQQIQAGQSKEHQSLRNELRGLIRHSTSATGSPFFSPQQIADSSPTASISPTVKLSSTTNRQTPLTKGKQQLSLFTEQAGMQQANTSRDHNSIASDSFQSPITPTGIDSPTTAHEAKPTQLLSLWLRHWLRKLSTELDYSADNAMAYFVRAQLLAQASLYLSQPQQILLQAFTENLNRSYAEAIEFVEFIESLSQEPAILHETSIIETLVKAARSYTAAVLQNYADIADHEKSSQKSNAQKNYPQEYRFTAGQARLKNWFSYLLVQEQRKLYPLSSSAYTSESDGVPSGNLSTEITADYKSRNTAAVQSIAASDPYNAVAGSAPESLSTEARDPQEQVSSVNQQVNQQNLIDLPKENSLPGVMTDSTVTSQDSDISEKKVPFSVQPTDSPIIADSLAIISLSDAGNFSQIADLSKITDLSSAIDFSKTTDPSETIPQSNTPQLSETSLLSQTSLLSEAPLLSATGYSPETISTDPTGSYPQAAIASAEFTDTQTTLTITQAKNFLSSMFIKGDPSRLETYWPVLLAEHPGLLVQSLRHFLVQPEIRQQLMVNFPLAILADMLELFNPITQPGFTRLLESANLLMLSEIDSSTNTQAGNSQATSVAASMEWWQRQLWEILLSTLIHQQPSTPDALFEKVINTYADLNNLVATDIEPLWKKIISGSAINLTNADSKKNVEQQTPSTARPFIAPAVIPATTQETRTSEGHPTTSGITATQNNLSYIQSLQSFLTDSATQVKLEQLLDDIEKLPSATQADTYQELAQLISQQTIRTLTFNEWKLLLTHFLDSPQARTIIKVQKENWQSAIFSEKLVQNKNPVELQALYQPLLMAFLQTNNSVVQQWIDSTTGILQSIHAENIKTGDIESAQENVDTYQPKPQESNDPLINASDKDLSANTSPTKAIVADTHAATRSEQSFDALLIHQLQGALVNPVSTTSLIHSLKQLQQLPSSLLNTIYLDLKQFIDSASDGDIALPHWQLLAVHLLETNETLHYLSPAIRKQLADRLSLEESPAGNKNTIRELNWQTLLQQLASESTNAQLFYRKLAQDLLAQTGKPLDSYLLSLGTSSLLSLATSSTPNMAPMDNNAHNEELLTTSVTESTDIALSSIASENSSLPQKTLREVSAQQEEKVIASNTRIVSGLIEEWRQQAGNPASLQTQIQHWEKLPPRQLQNFYQELGLFIQNNPSYAQTNWRLLLSHLLETYHKHQWLDFSPLKKSEAKPEARSSALPAQVSTQLSTQLSALGISKIDEAAALISDTKTFYKKLAMELLLGNTKSLQQLFAAYGQETLTTASVSENVTNSSISTDRQKYSTGEITAKEVSGSQEQKSEQASVITSAPLISPTENSTQVILDACMQLQTGQLPWSALPRDLAFLQRMLGTYIMKSGAVASDLQQDLLAAIDQYCQQTDYKGNYYLVVLGHLLTGKPLDLEDILHKLQASPVTPETATTSSASQFAANETTVNSSRQSAQPEQEIIASTPISASTTESPVQSTTAATQLSNQQVIQASSLSPGVAPVAAIPEGMEKLAQELISKKLSINNITLPEQQWTALVKHVIGENPVIAASFKQDLLNAIQQHLPATHKRTAYYRKILQQLLTNELLDVEAIALELNTRALSNPQDTSTQLSSIADEKYPAQDYVQSPTNEFSAQRDSGFNLTAVYDQVRAGNYASLDAGLNIAQWRQLISHMIGQNTQASAEFRIELANAIDAQAPKAINVMNFYRHLVIAFAEEKPLDLEALAIAPVIEHKSLPKQSSQTKTAESTGTTPDVQGTGLSMTDSLPVPQEDAPKALDMQITDTSPDRFEQLKKLLEQSSGLSHAQSIALQKLIQQILAGNSERERDYWLPLLKQYTLISRLIDYLPAHILHALFKHLFPNDYPALESMVKLLGEVLVLLVQEHNSPAIKKAKWQFIIGQLVAPVAGISKEELFEQLGQSIALAINLDEPQRLMNLLQRRIGLLKKPVPQTESSFQLTELARNNAQDQAALEQGIHLNNVGMVLMAPFMPRLFSMLKLTDQGKFIHMAAAERGAHLLQYAVTGTTEAPEYEMLLNKVLCGMNTSIPIADRFDITDEEKNIIEQLLQSMIQHWKVLGSTSIAGLRQTFLLRQGWLSLEENHWQLKVQPGTFDMLLDQLPWTIALIKHGWMDKPLHVNWR